MNAEKSNFDYYIYILLIDPFVLFSRWSNIEYAKYVLKLVTVC